jgi:hypothetical protein
LTIDGNRQLVPFVGSFPASIMDEGRWVREPWSSRAVAITFSPAGGGVSVLKPGSTSFEKIAGGYFETISVLPRRKITVVTSNTGASLTVGDRELTPWLSREQMAAHGVQGIYSVQDAPSLNAAVVVGRDSGVYVLTDDDEWYRVGTLPKKDYGTYRVVTVETNDHGPVLDAPGSQGVLLAGNQSALFIHKQADGSHFGSTVLDSGLADGASFPFKVSKLFGQVLTYKRGGLFGLLGYGRGWHRLTANRFESIPGGDVGPQPDLGMTAYGSQIQDLPTIGRTLIEGQDGLFLYDGHTITPIVGGARKVIGKYPKAYDLPSIRKVVVTTQNGMFNLTMDGRLVPMPTPFPADGWLHLADWPKSGVALVWARTGLFTLDPDLAAKPIQGGDAVGRTSLALSPFTGINPETGDMVLTGSQALFLAVDAARSHDDTCRGLR